MLRNRLFFCRDRSAFTILEVLIALTASLLLMLGLTRAFKLIGDRITKSQSDMEMSSSLREVTFRLRDELRRITPIMMAPQPKGSDAGYFTYYEGPWSDATTTLVHGQSTVVGTPNYYPTSRFGDLDDYLAFTTRSEPGRPFSGVIPSGVIEAARLWNWLSAGNAVGAFRTLNGSKVAGPAAVPLYNAADSAQSQVFYSELAEVAYFLSPNWSRDALGVPTAAVPVGSVPVAFDDIINESAGPGPGDGVPDELTLRRRVLLVRNDLNLTIGQMNIINAAIGAAAITVGLEGNQPQVPFLSGVSVLRLADLPRYSPGDWALAAVPQIANSPNWLAGMARSSQWMDLSLSRLSDPVGGTPLQSIRANGLEDLALPENRFGFVRMPINLLIGAPASPGPTSSMPILALGPAHGLIAANQSDGFITSSGVNYASMGGQVAGAAPFNQFSMVGFMRPEFSLADYWYESVPAVPAVSATLRGGSDIIANDVLGFDVQVFDPVAPVGVWFGPDGVPGSAGDDDGDLIVDNATEVGFANSDDIVVDVGSIGFRTALSRFDTSITPTPDYAIQAQGGFVDLGYVRLAGGPIGGVNPPTIGVDGRIPSLPALQALFTSPFSGIGAGIFQLNEGWMKSGRFVLSDGTGGTVNSFCQPMLDTWTTAYDSDPFAQSETPTGNVTFTGSPAAAVTTRLFTDVPSSGGLGGFISGLSNATSESNPPSETMPSAIKITFRVYDRKAGEVRQQTVIEHFTK